MAAMPGGIHALDDDSLACLATWAGGAAVAALACTSREWRSRLLDEQDRVWKAMCVARWGRLVSLEQKEGVLKPVRSVGGGAKSTKRRRKAGGNGKAVKSPARVTELNTGDDSISGGSDLGCEWYRYYRHRVSRWAAPSSPLGLAQELSSKEPWRLLSTCILCSRTSGGDAVRAAVARFFETYPTPSDVVEGDIEEMMAMLLPLGLNRERTIKRFADGFLGPWHQVTELYGCGAFAEASHTVFCKGDFMAVFLDKAADRNVRAYAGYCARLFGQVPDHAHSDELPRRKTARRKLKPRPAPKQRAKKPWRAEIVGSRRSSRLQATKHSLAETTTAAKRQRR